MRVDSFVTAEHELLGVGKSTCLVECTDRFAADTVFLGACRADDLLSRSDGLAHGLAAGVELVG